MEPGLYLITDGAWKGKTSLKAGSGIILHNIKQGIITQHQFMFDLANYSISKITYEVLNADLPPGKYRIELINQDGYLYQYQVGQHIILNIYTNDLKVSPTNNRAEYIAYILGHILCDIIHPNEPITLVSDSMLLINTLKVWMNSWVKKGIIDDKKNPDLIYEMLKLKKIKNYVHINSHLSSDKFRKLSPIEKEYSKLNDLADELANEAIL